MTDGYAVDVLSISSGVQSIKLVRYCELSAPGFLVFQIRGWPGFDRY